MAALHSIKMLYFIQLKYISFKDNGLPSLFSFKRKIYMNDENSDRSH